MVSAWENELFLPRPLSIHDYEDGRISFLFETRGEGTQILSRLKEGNQIELLGPLGNGFEVGEAAGKIAVVSGGLGIAPMSYLIKSLNDCEIDLYVGYRNDVYSIDELKDKTSEIHISTEGGSIGYKGYITELFNPIEYNAVFCCGPEIMMKKDVEKCSECGTPVYISMESHMACGLGACLVCTCKTQVGNKRVCKDGPVFKGREVIWNV
jgi:dihydroorotate dehydrogenase electron transfer subunit